MNQDFMNNNFLVVVDMQNDFLDGPLGSEEARAIVKPAAERILACRSFGYKIIATADTHYQNYLDTQEGRRLPVPHCICGHPGWEINSEIKTAMADAEVIQKTTFGFIGLPLLIQRFCPLGKQPNIEIIGLCTDICVVSNALIIKAFFPEATISVHQACCAGTTPEKHRAALETMKSCQIDIV